MGYDFSSSYGLPPSELVQIAQAPSGVIVEPGQGPSGVILVKVPPARPPEIAEREEFDAACAAGTAGALQLFIERHPQSRWRAEAQKRLDQLLHPHHQR